MLPQDRIHDTGMFCGRSLELDTLTSAWESVCAGGASVVWISGPAGIGKSALVEAFRRRPNAPVLFGAGKADQADSTLSGSALAKALEDLVRCLVTGPAAELHSWCTAIQDSLSHSAPALCSQFPDLELILGAQQPSVAKPGPEEARRQLQDGLRSLLRSCATQTPLALFLDDLQWSRPAMSRLLATVVAREPIAGLLVIAASRDDELSADHPLSELRLALHHPRALQIHELELSPLGPSTLRDLVQHELHGLDEAQAARLAELLTHKTEGSPLHVLRVLRYARDEGWIAYDPESRRWTFSEPRLEALEVSENLIEILATRLYRLAPQDLPLYQLAAQSHIAATAVARWGLSQPRSETAETDQLGVARLAQAFCESQGLQEVLEVVVRTLRTHADALRSVVVLCDPGPSSPELTFAASSPPALSSELGHEFPIRVVRYSIRVGAPVYLGRAGWPPVFAHDPYLNLHEPTSVSCIPLRHHGLVLGAVYLEDSQRSRASDLELLCSHAAVAIANARLIADNRRESAERERLEAVVQRAQKLEAVGELASSVAHEFNNLLGVILGQASALEHRLPAEDPSLSGLLVAARGAKELARQLLAYGRRLESRPQAVALDAAVRELESLVACLLPASVELRLDLAPVGAAWIDPMLLQQVLLNLVLNARDALSGQGSITVRTRARSGRTVLVSVEDDGHGIEPSVQARVFDPFFTTKPEGTGLGLSVVHGIIRQSGGELHLHSVPGEGTRFEIEFPRHAPAPSPAKVRAPDAAVDPPEPKKRPESSRGQHVLLVEDRPLYASVISRLLQTSGYEVATVSSAEAALELADSYDALVTDLSLPGLDGLELARRLRVRQPELGVVFMTGGHPAESPHAVPGAHTLKKPFDRLELLTTIEAVLTTRADPNPCSYSESVRP